MAELEAVVRSILVQVLDDSPNLRRGDLRYADHIAYMLARDDVADRMITELVSNGWLPFKIADLDQARSLSNFHAVSYTMGQMRKRLVAHIKGGGRDVEAEHDALSSIAIKFFSDLEDRGWRLVRTNASIPLGAHYPGPGFSGR